MNTAKWILIVDDDPRVLLVMRDVLEKMQDDYKIDAAESGVKAWDMTSARRYDLVITDLLMPGINGVELTEALRSRDTEVKVIWITAYGCENFTEERGRLNVHECLKKPLRIGEIRAAVREALAGNHQHGANAAQ